MPTVTWARARRGLYVGQRVAVCACRGDVLARADLCSLGLCVAMRCETCLTIVLRSRGEKGRVEHAQVTEETEAGAKDRASTGRRSVRLKSWPLIAAHAADDDLYLPKADLFILPSTPTTHRSLSRGFPSLRSLLSLQVRATVLRRRWSFQLTLVPSLCLDCLRSLCREPGT